VHMIVHQAPAKADRAVRRTRRPNQREIGAAIIIGKENGQSPVPALRDVVRNVRNNNA
jgi:hypothetical protein